VKTVLKHGAALLVLCALTLSARAAPPAVSIAFGAQGLSSLQVGGQELLWRNSADTTGGAFDGGTFWVTSVALRDADGKDISLPNGGPSTVRVESGQGRVTRTFAWGRVSGIFAAHANTLHLTISITNTSPATTVQTIAIQPLWLRFPQTPKEYDGVNPMLTANLGNPSAIALDYVTGTLALCNDDVTLPLVIGFPWALDRPGNTTFPLQISSGPTSWLHPFIDPYLDRPIPPGKSDTYTLSLRFGEAGIPAEALSGDIDRKFAKTYPLTLRWPDRRPIGYLILSSTVPHPPGGKNPRGWFNNDAGTDVTTPDGRAALAKSLTAYAGNSIRILKAMNAQGAITWDIEGQEFPHATSYLGDPRKIGERAPEMDALADTYFARLRHAGLRVGVCIRPQNLEALPGGGVAQRDQTDMAKVTQTLIAKALYANKRWGCTLFYVDSNGDPNVPYPAWVFEKLAAALKQHGITALLMPEHKSVRYYATTAPYAELRGGVFTTPERVQRVYPGAFTVINVADGDMDRHHAELVQAVRRGDILLFRAWFDDTYNAKVKAIYAEAGK